MMNERIRELALQAGLNAPYGSDHEGLRDFDYRKFAELIVRECIDAVYNDGQDAEYYQDCIKRRFGVE
jgi:hypothetical protein